MAQVIDTYSYFAKKLSNFNVLSKEEELALLTQAQQGTGEDKEDAREKLVEHNLKLVIKIAKKYTGAMDLIDLVQVGSIGLLKAIDLYDLNSGNKFSTYAFYWVLQAINKEVKDKGHPIRIPAYISEAIPRVNRAEEQLMVAGKIPTPLAISEITGDTESKVKKVMKYNHERHMVALDYESEGEDGVSMDLKTTIRQDSYEEPDQYVSRTEFENERIEAIHEALRTFSPRHRDIIIYRYGLDGTGKKRTLDEVSELVKVTKERVRQIEKHVFNLLREDSGYSNRRKNIRKYLE